MGFSVLVDAVVVLGVAVVLPLALGGARWWLLAALAVVGSLLAPTGPTAAALAVVWLLVAVVGLVAAVRRVGSRPLVRDLRAGRVHDLAVELGAPAFSVVAAGAFVVSRGGVTLLGIHEPIVELTAVHFTYAGVGALTLAGALPRSARVHGGMARAAAITLTVAAPPVVATGFLLEHPVPQVGGALLMTAGVLLTAGMQLREAVREPNRRVLLVVSGLAPAVPMALAVAWAASLYWDVPALSIPDMARTHGMMNVVFVVAGLLARHTAGRGSTWPAPHPPLESAAPT